MPRRRPAFFIGVNSTGGLPVLESAAAGAGALFLPRETKSASPIAGSASF
jgi:hypothetical protein